VWLLVQVWIDGWNCTEVSLEQARLTCISLLTGNKVVVMSDPRLRSRSPKTDGRSPPTQVLVRWASRESAKDAADELRALARRGLALCGGAQKRWRALCFRRDARALLQAKPNYGISDMPCDLSSFREFDDAAAGALRTIDHRMGQEAGGLPLNKLYGPWEGGMPACEAPQESARRVMPVILAALNVRGAFGHDGGLEAHDERILRAVAVLHAAGVVMAVISEPRFGPGMVWPSWTGYAYHGERSGEPDSVAVLVLEDAEQVVVPIGGVGDERAIWLELRTGKAGDGRGATQSERGMLVLGLYGYHAGYAVAIRRKFWQSRLWELKHLRSSARYEGWEVVVLGDFNLHFACLGGKNLLREEGFDREVLKMLEAPEGFGVTLRNEPGVATHKSGTIIDDVAASSDLQTKCRLGQMGEEGIVSDHYPVFVEVRRHVDLVQEVRLGRACWGDSAEWDEALAMAPRAFKFLVGWAGTAMRSDEVRGWVRQGRKRGTRQGILDRVVWWRMVLYVICGHLGGVVVAAGPRGRNRSMGTVSEMLKFTRHFTGDEGSDDDDENELKIEERLEGLVAREHAAHVDKYLELCATDPGAAEAYMSSLIKPKSPIQVELHDEVSGERLGRQGTLDALTRDVKERGAAAGGGDPVFKTWIEGEVKKSRKLALVEAGEMHGDPFTRALVDETVRSIKIRRRSVHLPRAALHVSLEAAGLAVWAIVNLAAVVGLVSSYWIREVAPLRKRGPTIVTDKANLRPVSYGDELAGVYEALWLALTRQQLECYSGGPQAGGKYDGVLMAIGVLIALQIRRNLGLPTFLQKSDLLQGFDLAWRDGILWNLWQAGVRGFLWLALDASFQLDRFRVRLGPLIGAVDLLVHTGVAQGRRAAVHLFGVLMKGLVEICGASVQGVGLDVPRAAVEAWQLGDSGSDLGLDTRDGLDCTTSEAQQWIIVREAVRSFMMAGRSALVGIRSVVMQTETARLLLLDEVSTHAILLLIFVDDTFLFQSTLCGLRAVNRSLTEFCYKWRHRFQGGRKRPSVMAIGAPSPAPRNCGEICGETPLVVESMTVLGPVLDRELSLQPLLDKVCAMLASGARALASTLNDFGFGLPYQCWQYAVRIETKALHGAELLASFGPGWSAVVSRLNRAQYEAAKCMLGFPVGFSLSDGGMVRVLAETRFLTRVASRLAQRIVLARARIMCLPIDNPIAPVLSGASAITGPTWLDDVVAIQRELGITTDFTSFVHITEDVRRCPVLRSRAVQRWKLAVVIPRIQSLEERWFKEQLAALNEDGLVPYADLVPLRKPFRLDVRWAPWGKTMWRFFRAWLVARITSGIPLAVWGRGGVPRILFNCPVCGIADADLEHVLCSCSGLSQFREGVPYAVRDDLLRWSLEDPQEESLLRARVRYLGLCISAVAHAKAGER